jgi:hypothetical protein
VVIVLLAALPYVGVRMSGFRRRASLGLVLAAFAEEISGGDPGRAQGAVEAAPGGPDVRRTLTNVGARMRLTIRR